MDFTQLATLFDTIKGNPIAVTIISIIIGSVLPSLIGMILPRKNTVQYGMSIYKIIGTIFLQKRGYNLVVGTDVLSRLIAVIRTTFVDLSFGVYLASREDLTKEVVDQKIEEYLSAIIKPVEEVKPPEGEVK
jgi:hypothetical protein